MAAITLGLGTSHTPMLLVDAADLSRYEENDRRLSLLDNDGAATTFEAQRERAGSSHAAAISAEAMTARHAAAQEAMARLADALDHAALDALIVIGDDQQEMLRGPSMPKLLVYTDATIRGEQPSHPPNRPDWVLRGMDRYYPVTPTDYAVHQPLARHILDALRQFGAEPAQTGDTPMGHAFAFVCTQLMQRTAVPLVPVLLNALYSPTQPTPAECLRIGAALAGAVTSFAQDVRIGIVASGGLSHFVVDETMDRAVVQAVAGADHAALAGLAERKLNSGSGEIRNWICAAGALSGLQLERIDYWPGYRTLAGTGTGLCFAIWR